MPVHSEQDDCSFACQLAGEAIPPVGTPPRRPRPSWNQLDPKRFLAPQVAEIVEQSDELMLKGQRREVVTIFGDLRDFTAFSARVAPDTLMGVLSEYYEALGAVITRHEATLTGFSGDGVMLLVNAPVAQADPALRAIRLAIDMQAAVQSLVVGWSAKGHPIGFGVGVATGPAIVGTVGYEGRIDYTAIGNAVNLASRLCGSANDGQILVDAVVAERVKDRIAIEPLGVRFIKGYDDPLQVFGVARSNLRPSHSLPQKLGRPVTAAADEVRTSDQPNPIRIWPDVDA